jgi:hypothetical protein
MRRRCAAPEPRESGALRDAWLPGVASGWLVGIPPDRRSAFHLQVKRLLQSKADPNMTCQDSFVRTEMAPKTTGTGRSLLLSTHPRVPLSSLLTISLSPAFTGARWPDSSTQAAASSVL